MLSSGGQFGRYADLNGYHRRIPMGSYKIDVQVMILTLLSTAQFMIPINYDEWVKSWFGHFMVCTRL